MELLIACITSYPPFPSWSHGWVIRAQWRAYNHALEFFDLLTQFRFLLFYLFLSAAERRRWFRRATKHRHHRLAIQKKIARATMPKIISGNVRATPIWNH